jgi:hypothetical protein
MHSAQAIRQHRRPLNLTAKLIFNGIFIVVATWVGYAYFLLQNKHTHIDAISKLSNLKPSTLRHSSSLASSPSAFGLLSDSMAKIIILLQQSPVDPSHQLARLRNIDQTWAKWVDGTSIGIYASIPCSRYNSSIDSIFRIVKPLQLVYSNSVQVNPFYHLVRGLLTILIREPQLEYIVLANDHTFMIPPNLNCLLKDKTKFNPTHPIYGGNMLQRGKYKHGK